MVVFIWPIYLSYTSTVIIRKLSINLCGICVSSFSKLIRMICVILSSHIGSNLLSVSLSPTIHDRYQLIILVINMTYNYSCSYKLSRLLRCCLPIRVGFIIRCIQFTAHPCRLEISNIKHLVRALINIYDLSVHRILRSGIFNSTFILRVLIATII